jgi:hypothetical protein
MRSLEARFHFSVGERERYVVVGHVVWDAGDTAPRVSPSPCLRQVSAPATLLTTLKHLVTTTVPDGFERLRALRDSYWSFVVLASDVSADTVSDDAA